VTVLAGYIDGSNLHDSGDAVVVAAWVADTEKWTVWERHWKALIDYINQKTRCRIDRWHHVDFMNKRKAFSDIREAEWFIARRMIGDAFEAAKPHAWAEAVFRKEYEQVRASHQWLPADPYYFLLDHILGRLVHGFFAAPKDEGILIYCDQDKNKALVLNLANWHEQYLRNLQFDLRGDRFREVMTAYGSDLAYMPIQAADVLAYETMLTVRSRGANEHPVLGAHVPLENSSILFRRIREACPGSLMPHIKNILEMEANGRAYVKGSEPGLHFLPPEGGWSDG
jgi:hypothetical protein